LRGNHDIISFNVIVLYNKITYKGGLRSTLKADSESQQTSEFKVKGSLRQYIENIDKNTIKEGKVYNGVTTSREEGVVVERSDGKAKTIMNATEGISIYSDLGSGLAKNFFVGLDGRIQAKGLDIDGSGTFSGTLSAADGTFSGIISASTITGSIITGGSLTVGTNYKLSISEQSLNGLINFSSLSDSSIAWIGYNNNMFNISADDKIYLYADDIQIDAENSLLLAAYNVLAFNSPYITLTALTDDIRLNTLYGKVYYNNNEIAIKAHDHGNNYVKSYTGQNLSLVATETGIVVRVNGVTLGSIFYD